MPQLYFKILGQNVAAKLLWASSQYYFCCDLNKSDEELWKWGGVPMWFSKKVNEREWTEKQQRFPDSGNSQNKRFKGQLCPTVHLHAVVLPVDVTASGIHGRHGDVGKGVLEIVTVALRSDSVGFHTFSNLKFSFRSCQLEKVQFSWPYQR
jgi:hypothetical protein